jgi:hypothetical protein
MDKSIGAFWEKEKAGKVYMTGSFEWGGEKIKLVAFKNDRKKNPNEPDWRVYLSKPKEQTGTEPF